MRQNTQKEYQNILMDGVNKYDGTGVKTGHAWNERTVDTIPYISISLYPYISIRPRQRRAPSTF